MKTTTRLTAAQKTALAAIERAVGPVSRDRGLSGDFAWFTTGAMGKQRRYLGETLVEVAAALNVKA